MSAEQKRNRSNVIFRLLVSLSLAAWPGFAATITVINTNDSGPGSLRDAITSASSGDTIDFNLAYPATIKLSSTLSIGTDLSIKGPGASNLAIAGCFSFCGQGVFSVSTGVTATISGVTIERGFASEGSGGGIANFGMLTVSNSIIWGNGALDEGGGIYNAASLTLTNSSVSSNWTPFTYDGGGIANYGAMTITNSTIRDNAAWGYGGGIVNDGKLTLTNSTVSDNWVVDGFWGGGIANRGTLIVGNSTISGNAAPGCGEFACIGTGGGIANYGTTTISNSTISSNSAGADGGGIWNGQVPSVMTVKNTILANNIVGNLPGVVAPQPSNCYGAIESDGHNISDEGSCSFAGPGDLNNIPAGLDPAGLKSNGGLTQTIALLATSPAVDAIPLGFCTAIDGTPIATDQRGLPRPQGSACDIGAIEYLAITAPAPASGSACNGAYNGTLAGNLTVSAGQNCVFFNGGVTGNVVQHGGSFVLFQSQIGGNVQVDGGGAFSIGPGSTISGNLAVQNLPSTAGQDNICGTNVHGNLEVQNNGTAVLIGGNPPVACEGNIVGGNLSVQSNYGTTSIVGNTIGRNVTDQNNAAATQVFNNAVSGNLNCQNDVAIQGGGNTAGKQKQGQCAGF